MLEAREYPQYLALYAGGEVTYTTTEASVTWHSNGHLGNRAAVVTVVRADEDSDTYEWRIEPSGYEGNDDRTLIEGAGLRGPEHQSHTPVRMLAALMSFLYAFAESQRYPHSENRDLFSAAVVPFAEYWSDEFGMAEADIEADRYDQVM